MNRPFLNPTFLFDSMTIATSTTDSNELVLGEIDADDAAPRDFSSIGIFCPAGPYTGTITLQAPSTQGGAGVWNNIESPPGTNITLTAGSYLVLTALPFFRIRAHSTASEASARAFIVVGHRVGIRVA